MESKDNLPFRKNCEGYFLNSEGKILAKDGGKGFIIFPGGGVDESENAGDAIKRETKEETGFDVSNLEDLGVLKILWDTDWVKTDKQKERYQIFQGDEMYFFKGVVGKEEDEPNEEDSWKGEKFMDIRDVINLIENSQPFDKEVIEYREMQLRNLRSLIKV